MLREEGSCNLQIFLDNMNNRENMFGTSFASLKDEMPLADWNDAKPNLGFKVRCD